MNAVRRYIVLAGNVTWVDIFGSNGFGGGYRTTNGGNAIRSGGRDMSVFSAVMALKGDCTT